MIFPKTSHSLLFHTSTNANVLVFRPFIYLKNALSEKTGMVELIKLKYFCLFGLLVHVWPYSYLQKVSGFHGNPQVTHTHNKPKFQNIQNYVRDFICLEVCYCISSPLALICYTIRIVIAPSKLNLPPKHQVITLRSKRKWLSPFEILVAYRIKLS